MAKEGFLSAIRSESRDGNLLYLFDVTLGMELAGFDTDEIFIDGIDGEKSAKSLIASARHFGLDACNGSVMWFDNRIFGNETAFPSKGIPYTTKFALSEPGRLSDLDVSMIPDSHLEQLSLSHSIVARSTDCALVNHTPSPLGAACSLRGLENIMMDMMHEPEFVNELLSFTTETTGAVFRKIAQDNEIDMCLISGAYDNIDLIGPEYLSTFSLSPLKRTIEVVSKSSGTVCFHPHGNLSVPESKNVLEKLRTMNIDCLYYGENNDPAVIHRYAPELSLMGGIDTFTTIVLGDEERVKQDTKVCMDLMKDCSYVFSCSCSVDRGLPLNNMDVMCQTVKLSSS